MKKNTKKVVGGSVAVVAAVSLLGGSYALWSDDAEVGGGTVTAGNLAVEAVESSVFDVSAYRGGGEEITDLSTWRAVPGDSVSIETALDVALEGDNLVAQLDTGDLEAAIGPEAAQYVTTTLTLEDVEGNAIEPVAVDAAGLFAEGSFAMQAGRDGQVSELVEGALVVPANLDTVADVTANVTINFSAETPDRVLAQTDLSGVDGGLVTLSQVTDSGIEVD